MISNMIFFSPPPTFSVGGSIPIVWSYFGEFQPKARRGSMLSWLAAFWMVGNVTVAGKETRPTHARTPEISMPCVCVCVGRVC